ncbi:4'-phosphopantetheinyl transferase superfamily protein [Herbiconiux sp. L3-i23]|uniref:4'-phosphopantetheinyl transferase family protein n=1 Tax=Herbiconiux sp. L3-i23 TaxID=2905871 RepID=UPI00207460CC|nr:hypothetical protein [Herbiconiux sp. L3-i23]
MSRVVGTSGRREDLGGDAGADGLVTWRLAGVAVCVAPDADLAGGSVDRLGLEERIRDESTPSDRRPAYRAGRLLLRHAVAQLGEDPGELALSARCETCGGLHGRPRVTHPVALRHLSLSVSHSQGVTAVAAATGRAIGIDLEARSDAGVPAMPDGFSTLAEWTRAEAVLKADGRGLRVDPLAVAVIEDAEGVHATIGSDRRRYRLVEPALLATHHLAVALAIDPPSG